MYRVQRRKHNYFITRSVQLFFYSIYEEEQFQEHMQEVLPSEYARASYSGAGSSCFGFACSSLITTQVDQAARAVVGVQ